MERKVKVKLLQKETVGWLIKRVRLTIQFMEQGISPPRAVIDTAVNSLAATAQVGEVFSMTFVKTENDTWVPKRI